jgi:hypothetical protein
LMKSGTKKESQACESAIESKTSKLAFRLSQRNYRALVYLLASIIINAWAFVTQGYISDISIFLNYVGFLLLLLFFGPPSMNGGGWLDPSSVLPFILLVFGLFVEILIAGEFLVTLEKSLEKLGSRIRKPQTLNSAS